MKYQVFEDNDENVLLFENNNFIKALKQARLIAIQKINRVFVYSTNPNSDMCISYDPLGGKLFIKEGKKLKEEKLEQLRKVFRPIIRNVFYVEWPNFSQKGGEEYLDEKINELLYEVKIRINNK